MNPIYANEIFFDKPREGSPEFVKGRLTIRVERFKEFLDSQVNNTSEKGYLNLDLLARKDKSGYYFTVNTFKPKEKLEGEDAETVKSLRENNNKKVEVGADDIPF